MKKINRRDFISKSSLIAISATASFDSIAKVIGVDKIQTEQLIQCSFRLTDWRSLLNLEFYFINVEHREGNLFRKHALKASYSQEEAYMIVRLPQQHIAEEYFDSAAGNNGECKFDENNAPPENWIAQTYISGYSYLVFKLLFDDDNKVKIPLTKQALLDWNNETLFRLVIRQNLQESLFTTKVKTIDGTYYENRYPFAYDKDRKYDPEKFPKVYGDPVTAIEAPWRLIISPKLPDQNKFNFKWTFSDTDKNEIWAAKLSITPRTDFLLNKSENNSVGDERNQIKSIDSLFADMELMFLGSPDHPKTSATAENLKILPTPKDRKDLVNLYIKYKLVALSDSLTFSPIGISTFFEFKNTKLDETLAEITLSSYKHFISFGRDVEVEVVNVILDKESGLKLLLVRTTKRRTKSGESFLDYREFILPLELEKNYENHIDADGISKFNNPFKSIRFLETSPKRICPLNSSLYQQRELANFAIIEGVKEGIFYPQVSDALGNYRDLTFEFEITDWHNKTTKITKRIQGITFGVNKRLETGTGFDIDTINTFFERPILELEKNRKNIEVAFSDIVFKANELTKTDFSYSKVAEQLTDLRTLLLSGKLNEILVDRRNAIVYFLRSQTIELKRVIQALVNTIVLKKEDFDSLFENFRSKIIELENKLSIDRDRLRDIENEVKAEIAKSIELINETANNIQKELTQFEEIYNKFKDNNQCQIDLGKKIKDIQKKIDDSIDQDEIVELKKELATVKSTLDSFKIIETELRIQYKEMLELKDIDPTSSLVIIVNKTKKVNDNLNKQLEIITRQINAKKEEIEKKYAASINKLKNTIILIAKEIQKIQCEISSNLEKVQQNLRTSSYLFILEAIKTKFDTIEINSNNLLSAFLNNLEGFLTLPQNNDLTKILIQSIEAIACQNGVDVLDADNKPIIINGQTLKYDLNPLISTYFNEIISKLKTLTNEFSFRYLRVIDKVDAELQKIITDFNSKVIAEIINLKEAEQKVRNAIYTYRAKIGYAVNEIEDDVEDFINDQISALETDFIIIKGELKTIENRIDFFHQYSSIPQLQHAQVYIESLSKLVNEEISVGIRYAREYTKNQVDLVKLEVQKNASRVFAEIKAASKSEIQGKIRQISAEMGGLINPEIALDYLTYLRDVKEIPQKLINELPDHVRQDISRVKDEINNVKGEIANIKNQIEETKKQLQNVVENSKKELENRLAEAQEKLKNEIENYKTKVKSLPIVNDLVLIGNEAKNLYDEVKSFNPDTFFKNLEAKILGSIYLKEILGLDFELPRLTPNRDGVTYNFMTNQLKSKDFSFFKFVTDTETKFQIYLSKKFSNGANSFQSFTKLNNFKFVIRFASEDVLLIAFKEFRVSTDGNGKKVSVVLDKVTFGGPLDFFGKLAEKLKMPGSGLRIIPSFSQLEVGYLFPIPGITSPAFNFTNLKINIGVIIPFARQGKNVDELQLEVGINRPEDKFLISAGIFGGRGHFILNATPKNLTKIDAGIEFGGYIGINLGIASGYVFLFAGIRLKYEKMGDLTLVGYLICEGGVTVFGFISIYITLLLSLTYKRIGGQASLYGSASLRYSVKIGFFKKSFTISFSKTIAGAKGGNIQSDEATSYKQSNKEPVFYASTDTRLSEYSDYEIVDENNQYDLKAEKAQKRKEKKLLKQSPNSFKKIYSKKQWDMYCDAFNL